VDYRPLGAREAAAFLRQNRDALFQCWLAAMREAPDMPHAEGLPEPLLVDNLPQLVEAIADYLDQSPGAGDEEDAGKGAGLAGEPERHARLRFDVGYNLPEIMRELSCLRIQTLRLMQDSAYCLLPEAALLIHTAIDTFGATAGQRFLEWRTAELAQTAALREQVMAILGHDLRNPLTTIRLSAELILRMADEPDSRFRPTATRAAARMVNSAKRMARMIQDVLDFTRTRLGIGIPLKPVPVDLNDICRGIVEELAVSHADRDLAVRATGDLHGVWDPDRLQQVVENLLSNALRYSPPDTSVQLRLDGLSDDEVRIAVHNAGPAIGPDDLERLFEPFRQGNRQVGEDAQNGLGLGLFIVQAIAWAHGGTIDVTSTDADGTTFVVTLPRQVAETQPSDDLPSRHL
jgi:signal transduction histidine kinase